VRGLDLSPLIATELVNLIRRVVIALFLQGTYF